MMTRQKQISLLFIFYSGFSLAQIDVAFIRYLDSGNFKREYRSYLDHLPGSDSASYEEARFSLKYLNDSAFFFNYSKSAALCNQDTLLLQQAGAKFLLNTDQQLRGHWFMATEQVQSTKSMVGLRTAYLASIDPRLISPGSFLPELQESFSKYKTMCLKKPALAACLSVILPGSGKFYAGRPRSFLMSFTLNAAYGAQTYESAKKLGFAHPFTLVNAGAFLLFYAAGIYGSYHDILKFRKERKKQFLTDAARFYN